MSKHSKAICIYLFCFFGFVPLAHAGRCHEVLTHQASLQLSRSERLALAAIYDLHFSINENEVEHGSLARVREDAVELVPPDRFFINEVEYRKIRILGSGMEGLVVAAVSSDNRLDAIKFFHFLSELKSNLGLLHELKKRPNFSHVVETLAIDETHRAVVFEYIHGLPLSIIQKAESPLLVPVASRYEDLARQLFENLGSWIYNSVLEIHSGKIFLIDSR